MAKAKKQKATKSKLKAVSGGGSAISKVAKAGASMLGIGGKSKGGSRRRKKHSAIWYAKETQRLKMKRKYEREKMRV